VFIHISIFLKKISLKLIALKYLQIKTNAIFFIDFEWHKSLSSIYNLVNTGMNLVTFCDHSKLLRSRTRRTAVAKCIAAI